jgi:DNA end-binding protein Ku
MARPIWSGVIAFGIVSIPVQLYAAVREHDLHFHQISRSDRRRIRYQKVVEEGGDPVPANDIVKGYQVGKGQYVTFDAEELKRLASAKSSTMSIESFIRIDEIDPRYFATIYYLSPGQHSEKPYRLLHRAMLDADLVGQSRLVMHGKEHLVVIRSLPTVLTVQTLRFADEIQVPDHLGSVAKAAITRQELDLAGQLIASMSRPFRPESFRDEHLERLRTAIARKAKGRTLSVAEEETALPPEGTVNDLLTALDRSLRSRQGPGAAAADSDARRARRGRPLGGSTAAHRRRPGAGHGHAAGHGTRAS